MLSVAEGHNYLEAGRGWICSSGGEQLAIVGSLLSPVPNCVTSQTTDKSHSEFTPPVSKHGRLCNNIPSSFGVWMTRRERAVHLCGSTGAAV